MSKEGTCQQCYSYGIIELHHIIKRSNAKFLERCKFNFINLCPDCHRGTWGVHGKHGRKLDLKLKTDYQAKIELLLDKQYFSQEELKDIFKINSNSINSMCKLMKSEKGMFSREEILKACMGGKMIAEGEETQ